MDMLTLMMENTLKSARLKVDLVLTSMSPITILKMWSLKETHTNSTLMDTQPTPKGMSFALKEAGLALSNGFWIMFPLKFITQSMEKIPPLKS